MLGQVAVARSANCLGQLVPAQARPLLAEREDDVDVRCRIRKQRGVEFLEFKSETVSPSKKQLVEILVWALSSFQKAPIIGHAAESHVAFGDVVPRHFDGAALQIQFTLVKGEWLEQDSGRDAVVKPTFVLEKPVDNP